MKKLIIIIATLCTTQMLLAQSFTPEVFCSGSGSLTNGTTNVYWTLGETIILTGQTAAGRLSSGFVQPSYILTSASSNKVDYGIKLFPNPTSDILTIQTNSTKLRNAHYQLFDLVGKEIINGNIDGDFTMINCNELTSSVYWLKISDANNQLVQSYKIVKQ